MPDLDLYKVLMIEKNAIQAEVKAAYRKLALQYHPDRNKDNPEATEKMMEVNEAYAILSDPVKRQEYDQLHQQNEQSASARYRQTHTTEDIFRGSDINQVYAELAKEFGLRGFDKVFREAYGQRFRSFEFQNNNMRGRAFIFYDRPQHAGSGLPAFPFDMNKMMQQMSKSGKFAQGKDSKQKIALSPRLAAEGGEAELQIRQQKTVRKLMISIPPGIRHGQQIRLRGMGAPGKGGGQPGDLYLQVQLKPDSMSRLRNKFKR
jgi:DnaJ-class molecular chaperone